MKRRSSLQAKLSYQNRNDYYKHLSYIPKNTAKKPVELRKDVKLDWFSKSMGAWRQYIKQDWKLKPYTVDFYVAELRLVVEIWEAERKVKDKDELRFMWYNEKGYKVVRVTYKDAASVHDAVQLIRYGLYCSEKFFKDKGLEKAPLFIWPLLYRHGYATNVY